VFILATGVQSFDFEESTGHVYVNSFTVYEMAVETSDQFPHRLDQGSNLNGSHCCSCIEAVIGQNDRQV
jgi:hypothetical protein